MSASGLALEAVHRLILRDAQSRQAEGQRRVCRTAPTPPTPPCYLTSSDPVEGRYPSRLLDLPQVLLVEAGHGDRLPDTMNILMKLFGRSKDDPQISMQASELQHALTVISASRRRETIEILHERRSVGLSDLVDAVAATESGSKPVTSTERNRVYTALYQTHIPTLDEHGLIDYDAEQQVLDATDKLDVVHAAMTTFAIALNDCSLNKR